MATTTLGSPWCLRTIFELQGRLHMDNSGVVVSCWEIDRIIDENIVYCYETFRFIGQHFVHLLRD